MGELTGSTFAGLEVRDAIGRDPVSTVYEAVESDEDRVVALRVIAQDLALAEDKDRALYERYVQSACAALTFTHPHAATVEEVGEHRGRSYLISSYVDTMSFADYLDEHGPVGMDTALALFAQIADVLDAGHRAGMTHGAVNPTTLRIEAPIGAPPTVRLTGFGIGSLLELRIRRDRKHLRVVDELLYVAPEQLRRQQSTGRADQYAMACALVHALTGAPPFVRDSVGGLFGAHLFVAPTADADEAVDATIAKGLAKEPRDRFGTCGQMIADLQRTGRSAANRERAASHRQIETPQLGDGQDVVAGGTAVRGATHASVVTDAEPERVIVLPEYGGDRAGEADDHVAPAAGGADQRDAYDGSDVAGASDAGVTMQPRTPQTGDDIPAAAPTVMSATVADEAEARTEGAPADDPVDAKDGAAHPPSSTSSRPGDADDAGDRAEPGTAPGVEAPDADRAPGARSNGERARPAPATTDDNSSTTMRPSSDIAYPSAVDESKGNSRGGAAEDLDDVPLLSDVLSRRPDGPPRDGPRPSGALLVIGFLAVVIAAAALWIIVS